MSATALARQLSNRPLHLLLATCVLGTLLSIGVEIVSLPKPAAAKTGGLGYTAITPCRVADTRLDLRGRFVQDGAFRDLQVTGTGQQFATQGGTPGGCSVPVGAAAAEVTITAVGPVGSGFLRAFPTGAQSTTSTFVSYSTGQSVSNTGTLALAVGSTANLRIQNFIGASDFVIEIQGYYQESGGSGYAPVQPCRVVDTRIQPSRPTVINETGTFAPGNQRSFQVSGTGQQFAAQGGAASGCGIPAGTTAVELSITAVGPSGNGFIRAFPHGQSAPNATFLSYSAGEGVTNTGTVTLTGGRSGVDLSVLNLGASTNIVIDVFGFFIPGAGSRYIPVPPCRVLDTRTAGVAFVPKGVRSLQVGGIFVGFASQGASNPKGCGVAERAQAVEVSLTAVTPASTGFLRAAPAGSSSLPIATALNYVAGKSITNTASLPLGEFGRHDLTLQNFSGATNLVIDVQGYFAATSLPEQNAMESMDLGDLTSCAVNAFGFAACWGRGPLGNGESFSSTQPRLVSRGGFGLAGVVQIALGTAHSCALIGDGSVHCWGFDTIGELGTASPPGVVGTTLTPGLAMPGVGGVQIAVGGRTTCVLMEDTTVRCWGAGESGQLGNNSTLNTRSFTTLKTVVRNSVGTLELIPLTGVGQVELGAQHGCALMLNGTVQCWGLGSSGQLGAGGVTSSFVPRPVPNLFGVTQIAAGDNHNCALLANGSITCWGANISSQLGDNSSVNRLTPTLLRLEFTLQISAGASHSCASSVDGIRCWGANSQGQLGNGTLVPRRSPGSPFGRNQIQVSTGGSHSCSLLVTGVLSCWGKNNLGQVGDGQFLDRNLAVPVSGIVS